LFAEDIWARHKEYRSSELTFEGSKKLESWFRTVRLTKTHSKQEDLVLFLLDRSMVLIENSIEYLRWVSSLPGAPGFSVAAYRRYFASQDDKCLFAAEVARQLTVIKPEF
jgi:hypothetical protein